MARLWHLYHPELPTDRGTTVELSRDETHHVRRVLRLGAGQVVSVFDGRGRVWRATIVEGDARGVCLRLDRPIEESVEPPIRIALYQGLCRPDKMEWVVQKATEVGVAAIHPVTMDRSGPHACTERRLARWRRVAIEACKQCGRSRVPVIEHCAGLPPVSARNTTGLLLDPAEGAPALGAEPPERADELWLAVGPEGGLTADEVAGAVDQGWRRTSLGPRILRTDTAGLVAATILLHRFGDLGAAAPAAGSLGPD